MIKTILLLPIWLFVIATTSLFSYNLIADIYVDNFQSYLFLGYGFIAYYITLIFFKPVKYKFWNTLRHEFLHAVFALITFSKSRKLVAAEEADEENRLGYLSHTVSSSSKVNFIRKHLIGLAPYFIPFFTLIICGLYLLVKPDKAGFIEQMFVAEYSCNAILAVIGFTYAYETFISFSQAKPYQSDFDGVGYKYGMVFVFMIQSLSLLVILYLLALDFDSTEIMVDSYQDFFEIKDFLYDLIR